MKRTQIDDFKRIENADDLNEVVRDKREQKRANKKKAKRRNRHYHKILLKHLKEYFDDQNQSPE